MTGATPLILSYGLVALGSYAVGALPFGYLIYYAITKTDVRTVGSGNIGATNVGRLLGFRFFVFVFLLDVLKGLLPTLGLPWLAATLGLPTPPELPVVAALAAILGHNFPIYLGFRGGKGVATSLGALLALQPAACGAAAIGFFAVFLLTRYVSLSSMVGGLAFAAAYFAMTTEPWSREHRAMSLLALLVVALLIVRHRKNIGRLLAGTESRVTLRGRKAKEPTTAPPAGKIQPVVLAGLALAVVSVGAAGSWLVHNARTPVEVVAETWLLTETDRQTTGQQRAERIAFNAEGDRVAVMCPRYNHVLVYPALEDFTLGEPVEIEAAGRPVAIAVVGENVVVLQRPVNDDKHLEPGWAEVFGLDGSRIGPRITVGFYPDDLAASPDGRFLFVLCSGRGEGDADKPLPELTILPTTFGAETPAPVGRLEFEPDDDPDRLAISSMGTRALVTLAGSERGVAIDLADPAAPRAVDRLELPADEFPYVSAADDGDWIIMPTGLESEAVALSGASNPDGSPGHLLFTRPDDSSLALVQLAPRFTLGRFPVMGPLNLGRTEPADLAYCERRQLVAVATKSGAVHLIRLQSRLDAR